MSLLKVSQVSAPKTSTSVKDAQGNPVEFISVTFQKEAIRLEAHPITGELVQVVGLPITSTETQFLSAGTSASGKEVKVGLYAQVKVGQYVEGDILRLPVEPYTGTPGTAYADKTYQSINQLFLGPIDQDSPEFEARMEARIEAHNARMVAEGRVAQVPAGK